MSTHDERPEGPTPASAQRGQRTLQAFADRDYASCVEQFPAFLQTAPLGVPALPRQIALISLQRLGRPEAAEHFGRQFQARSEMAARVTLLMGDQLAWDGELIKLTVGEVEPAEVLARAADDRQRCQAHYYAGARHLTLASRSTAYRARMRAKASWARPGHLAERQEKSPVVSAAAGSILKERPTPAA
jgi:hypothetical protein